MMDEKVISFNGLPEDVKDDAGYLPLVEPEGPVVGPADQVVGVDVLDDPQWTSHAGSLARSLPKGSDTGEHLESIIAAAAEEQARNNTYNNFNNALEDFRDADKALKSEKDLLDRLMEKCLRDKRENNADRNCQDEYSTGWDEHVKDFVESREKARRDVLKKGEEANAMPSNPEVNPEGDMNAIEESNQNEIDSLNSGITSEALGN